MNELGLKHQEDYIFEAHLVGHIEDSDETHANVIIHHNDFAINKFTEAYLSPLENLNKAIGLSFYADGFTNKLLRQDLSDELADKLTRITLKNTYSFDVPLNVKSQGLANANNEVVSSELIARRLIHSPLLKDKVMPLIEKIADQFDGDHLCLMALRPWGSTSFQGGAFYFDNADSVFSDIVERYIDDVRRALPAENVHFAIRPDSRDYDYTHRVASQVASKLGEQVVVVDDEWPQWMTLDYFIAFFHVVTGKKLSLVTFDSTAGHPFLDDQFLHTQFVGIPEACATLLDGSEFGQNVLSKSQSVVNHLIKIKKANSDFPLQIENTHYATVSLEDK
ncbi:MAG TPA: hypothetical protein DD979_06640 [Gammaproteobacteria bacterium]|jgi:hypothetical protein|nr:hypothetical protein [Gammaproteobacteria bacterium]